ncbi:MAG: glycosyltransferase [Acidimicrobiia bacterium]|nr:glycosyltransferase [Acidimicrobiia bacterium]MDH5519505.1 glycosyltransferase [Acidimicrobiia bacterium]
MTVAPAVSAIIIFLNEERFLAEAIESVQGQTFNDWELILVDDGSTDGSGAIAGRAADRCPRTRVVHHPDRANRGMSASRNLGASVARGELIAFLDGDDIWLPDKLERQVALHRANPMAAMIVAPLLRWRTWTGDPEAADLEDLMGVGRRKFGSHPHAGRLVPPPDLAVMMLSDDYLIPGGALIRRHVLTSVGGYEEAFRTMFEDAVAMMKIAVEHPVYVDDHVTYYYRMHPDSCTNTESDSSTIDRRRTAYLDFVEAYLNERGLMHPPLARALRNARRSTHHRRHRRHRLLGVARAVGRHTMPRRFRDALRRQWRIRTSPKLVP